MNRFIHSWAESTPHLVAIPGRLGMRDSSTRFGIRYLTIVLVLVVVGGAILNSGGFSVVALAHLVGVGVLRQHVRVVGGGGSSSAEETEETPASAVARSVVVGGTRTKSLLLASVTDEHELDQCRDDEEDANYKLVSCIHEGRRVASAYTATMETARQAVCIWHACL